MSHKCSSGDSCNKCQVLEKKLQAYEKFMHEMKEIDDIGEPMSGNSLLEESVIFEKDNEGNIEKKVRSELTESILVLDHMKNVETAYKKEREIIKEQDNLASYDRVIHCTEKATGVYTAGTVILSMVRFALFL